LKATAGNGTAGKKPKSQSKTGVKPMTREKGLWLEIPNSRSYQMSTIVWSRVIQVTPFCGALVVYGSCYPVKHQITVRAMNAKEELGETYYENLKDYKTDDGKIVRAAIFSALPPGNYMTQPGYGSKKVTVFPGMIAEVEL
jgi:hypothetical protein